MRHVRVIDIIKSKYLLANNFLVVTLLAIHYFLFFFGRGSEKSLSRSSIVWRTLTTITFSFRELHRISQSHSIQISLVWVSPRNRKIVLSIEIKFLLGNAEWLLGCFTLYGPIEDIIWYLSNIFWKKWSLDDFFYFWKWRFVVWPVESSFFDLIFTHWVIYITITVIVSKGTEFRCEKWAPFARFLHMFNNTRNKEFIFLFRILLVQYTILLTIMQWDTSKTIGYISHATRTIV